MDISIIIVSYNVKEYIVSCIQSIYKHSKSNYSFEIVVVDNNSKDETIESLNKNFPNISLIKNNFNAGFSAGVNSGVAICKGKYILVLNPDTMFVEDTISMLINATKNQKRLGAIGPALINENGNKMYTPKLLINSGYNFGKLLLKYQIGFQSVMLRKFIIQLFIF